jgi:hypothetical protein
VNPVGRLITGAPESLLFHEAFQQVNLKTAVEDSVFGPTDQNPRSVLP